MEACDTLTREVHVLGLAADVRVATRMMEQAYSVLIPTRDDWARVEGDQLLPDDDLVTYTDGSRIDGSTGSGVFFCSEPVGGANTICTPLGRYATVFQAEVYAIYSVVKHMIESGVTGRSIHIYSDSQAALKSLNKCRVTSCNVHDCLTALNHLGSGNDVSLCWIPGHTDRDGNDCADSVARAATEERVPGTEPALPISYSSCKLAVREWSTTKHARRWAQLKTCRHARTLLAAPSRTRRGQLCKLTRTTLRHVVGVYTGHTALNKHLTNMGVVKSPLCSLCGQGDETALHYLGGCLALARKRFLCFGVLTASADQLAGYSIQQLAKYITTTGRFKNTMGERP
jgi:ribonuclease HI